MFKLFPCFPHFNAHFPWQLLCFVSTGCTEHRSGCGQVLLSSLGISQEPLRLMGQSFLRDLSSSVSTASTLPQSHKTYQSTYPVHPYPLSTCPALPHLFPTSSSLLTHFTSPSVTLQRATDLVKPIRSSSNSTWSCSFGNYEFVVVLF